MGLTAPEVGGFCLTVAVGISRIFHPLGYGNSTHTYATGNYSSGLSTMVWLMGHGTSDSYANGIRTMTYPSDQNYGKMQLNNMQSSAIVNVSISGLS